MDLFRTIMLPARRVPFIVALAAAAALSLTGCGAAVSATSTPAAAGSTTSGAQTPSSAPESGDVATYTFPDGRLSFKYPADWRVDLFTGAGEASQSGTATVFDASGTEQVTVYAGKVADGVTHPVRRTVFESEPVPGLGQQAASAAHYSFYVDRMDKNPTYRMHLTAGAPPAGDASRLDGIIRIGDGVLVADVKFIEKPFASDDAEGAEGRALKALLLSMSYK